VSELRSAIEALRCEEDFGELQSAVEALEAERLRRLAEIDRRRSFERDGYLSAAAWLADRFRVAWNEARRGVALARGLDRMPRVRRAFHDGTISLSAVRLLGEARQAEPEGFRVSEGFLTDAATRHSIGDLRRVVVHWRHVVERERVGAAEGGAALRARRRLHSSVTLDGMVRLDGDLDPETGETVLTALRAVLDAEARTEHASDDRAPAQRRADALGEVCRGWLDRADRPEVGGERPHLTVTVPVEALAGLGTSAVPKKAGDRGVAPSLDHVGPIDAATVCRFACDASVTRVVHGRAQSLSTSAAGPRSFHRRSGVRGSCATGDVGSRDAIDRLHSATRTTSRIGSTAERPRSTTSSCSAVAIIDSPTSGSRSR
jgi:hypothetical protein